MAAHHQAIAACSCRYRRRLPSNPLYRQRTAQTAYRLHCPLYARHQLLANHPHQRQPPRPDPLELCSYSRLLCRPHYPACKCRRPNYGHLPARYETGQTQLHRHRCLVFPYFELAENPPLRLGRPNYPPIRKNRHPDVSIHYCWRYIGYSHIKENPPEVVQLHRSASRPCRRNKTHPHYLHLISLYTVDLARCITAPSIITWLYNFFSKQ